MRAKFSKVLAALALSGAALVSNAAHADRGYFAIGFASPGFAYHPGGHYRPDFRPVPDRVSSYIDRRQDRQMERIREGIRSGVLSPREARALMREQHEIAWLEDRFMADGHLSRHERLRLDRELEHASRHIYAEKHDRHDRSGHYPYYGRGWR